MDEPMKRSRNKATRSSDAALSFIIPLVVVGLAIADFARDGQVDKLLIGALMVFGLSALGYRVDTLISQYITRGPAPAELTTPPPAPAEEAKPDEGA